MWNALFSASYPGGTGHDGLTAVEAHRKGLLQLFLGVAIFGGVLYLAGVVAEDGIYSRVACCVFLWCLSLLLIFILSNRLADLTLPLVLSCTVLDVVLSFVTLTDDNPRDLYLWFLCIPIIMLYVRGVGSCIAVSIFLTIQINILRYVAERVQPFSKVSGFRQTLVGEAMGDIWFFFLIITFSVSNHMSRSHALKRLQLALDERQQTNAKLQQATKAKTDFLANMSHELRTPMYGIIAMSRELQDMLPPHTKAKQAIEIISHCADHLLALVNDILDFERIECNQLELEQIPFSVVSETYKVIDMVRVAAEKKHLTLSTNISAVHPMRIGDPVRFRQILFNLLTNSCKFTPEHGSVSLILNGGDPKPGVDDQVELVVKDTGIGISKEHLSRLFSCFSQVDTSVNRRYGGSGLGLAITKRLCHAMGGAISCMSELGKGSTFTVHVRLPILAADSSKDPEDDLPEACAKEQERKQQQEDASKLRFKGLEVLLVEDNEVNQKVGKRILTTLGCHVTVAANGVECLKAIEGKNPQFKVILMDCQMPIMDGFQATRQIREREQARKTDASWSSSPQQGGPDEERKESDAVGTVLASEGKPVPIIALTASATKEYRAKCLEVGMSDVLFKPVRREALAVALKKWILPDPSADLPPAQFYA